LFRWTIPTAPEWNFTAVSHKKRILAGELIRRLREKFAPGALLHYGQGKWYPGEPLPRWALAAYWRKDGVPVWKDDSLIADESKDYGHGAKEAKELATRIAKSWWAWKSEAWLIPAYEDAFYYTWKERRLPSNVTPEKSNLKDKLERDRIARIFQQGSAKSSATRSRSSARGWQPAGLDERQLVFARRRHALAHPRRFADGPAPAAGFRSVGGGKRLSVALSAARSVAAQNAGTAQGISVSARKFRPAFRAAAARPCPAAQSGPGQRAQKLGGT
jgi:hypothetical protein